MITLLLQINNWVEKGVLNNYKLLQTIRKHEIVKFVLKLNLYFLQYMFREDASYQAFDKQFQSMAEQNGPSVDNSEIVRLYT